MTREGMQAFVDAGHARWLDADAIEISVTPDLHRFACAPGPRNPVVAPGGPAIYRLRPDLPGLAVSP